MKAIFAIIGVFVSLFANGDVLWGQTSAQGEVAQIVARSQEALDQHDDVKALNIIRDGLRRFPGDEDLQVQMAAVYADQNRDHQAIALLKEVINKDPSSRPAKLKLAQIHGYRGEYRESDRLYRELLSSSADDETAALGLVHNLILEGKREAARQQAQQALQRHPTSLLLQQYNDSLSLSKSAGEARSGKFGRIQTSESFFSDSSGNRVVDSFQGVLYQFTRDFSSRFRLFETSLWRTTTPAVSVVSGDDEVRYRMNKYVAMRGSGGAVRYADTSSKWIASGDLDLFPVKHLTVSGGYSRYPVTPTFDSTLFDLLAEGWHSRVDYRTRDFTLSGNFYLTHYSDGNRAEREWGEMLRWFGPKSGTLSIGTGYAFRHLRFARELDHGYFSPNQYWSHLGGAGLRVRISKHYRAELLAYGGAETQDAGAYTPAGEASLRNDFNFGKWELAADYSYFHLAQATGAFHASAGTVSLGYRF